MWPPHYRQFVERHRLVGTELEVPDSADLSGVGASIGLYDEAAAREEAEGFYPGLVVKDDGFVPIGQDLLGGGDPYFINIRDSPPGPVYRIYHDSVADRDYNPSEAIARVLESYEQLLGFVDA